MTEEFSVVGVVLGGLALLVTAWKSITAKTFDTFMDEHKEMYNSYNQSKDDHGTIEKLKEKSNKEYLEFALSNERLIGEIRKLDSDVRHEVANLRTSINGFGARLAAIEEDVKERTKENEDLEKRIERLEKCVQINN
jgi:septal ring factor EnvC (AmiA/AmiB activator)